MYIIPITTLHIICIVFDILILLSNNAVNASNNNIPLKSVRAFQLTPNETLSLLKWPEMQYSTVAAKAPNGLCFSGGGSRSYVGAMGVLRALTDLKVIEHIRYVGGASGGGWAATAVSIFCFFVLESSLHFYFSSLSNNNSSFYNTIL